MNWEKPMQAVKIALMIIFGTYFVWWSLEILFIMKYISIHGFGLIT